MDEKVVQNSNGNGNKWTPVVIAVVGAFVGSLGTVSVYLGTPLGQEIARPDPFTGRQAAALETRIGHLENDLATHFRTHPDKANQFDRRITVLEVQYNGIMEYLKRIDKKLDNLSR